MLRSESLVRPLRRRRAIRNPAQGTNVPSHPVSILDSAARLLGEKCSHANLNEACEAYGLSIVVEPEIGSRVERVRARLKNLDPKRLPKVVGEIADALGDLKLSEEAWAIAERDDRPITEITRRDIALCLDGVELSGGLNLIDFLGRIWPLDTMSESQPFGLGLADAIRQHFIKDPDWSTEELFQELNALSCSRKRFGALLEHAVHPLARRGAEQLDLVNRLNPILERDGYRLEVTGAASTHPVYGLRLIAAGVHGRPKNLIFASNGPKPTIGFADAINNDIVVLSNEESCLVYDRPIPAAGLLWHDLGEWYAATHGADESSNRHALGTRLTASLDSDAEKKVFGTYFRSFSAALGSALPALIPQVYLHYDPAVVSRLRDRSSFPRQRMDFLLLLPHNSRIVIEVDGKHHFERNGLASLPAYAEMVSADRDLRLLGYEVYRFGANELVGPGSDELIAKFFGRLFEKHGIGR